MVSNLFREAGLPKHVPDTGGAHERYNTEIGVVRAVHADIWCVDVETQAGGLLTNVQVADYALPHVHEDGVNPSLVELWHRGGEMQDVWCRRVHWRRFLGPETPGEADKRYYHKHLKIERVGDITIRITDDQKYYISDAESGDYCLYDQGARTFHVIGPHVFVGTEEHNRIELHTEGKITDQLRIVIPKALIGATAVEDADGISYKVGEIIHLVSSIIKLTAQTIVLDPVSIKLGHANATERVPLGDLLMAFMNTFFMLYNGHQHSNVQNGLGTSGAPTVATPSMTAALLSDVTRVSKSGV